MGRPREFDLDEALESAVQVFWQHGYEGTSLTDLTDAMQITRPSLYHFFGNKEELFRKVVERYNAVYLGFTTDALGQTTAREVVTALLKGYADAHTNADTPPGCLGTNGALACSDEAEPIKQSLIDSRHAMEKALLTRLKRAHAEGDLPADADAAALASFVMIVAHGMAVKASSGASRKELHKAIDMTLAAWPS